MKIKQSVLNAKLKSAFSSNAKHAESKRAVVNDIYSELNQNAQPVMTQTNLIKAIRYIRTNHVKEHDYAKVIGKMDLTPNRPLSRAEVAKIYDRVLGSVNTNVTPSEAKKVIDRYISFVARAVEHGDSIRLGKLGQFKRQRSSVRHYRNPQTGKRGETPAHYYPAFHASIGFKRDVK